MLQEDFEQANEFSSLAVYEKLARKSTARIFLFLTVFMLLFSCDDDDGRKEIPFELANNRIILNVGINGKSGKFLWDTGVGISLFDCGFSNLDFSRREKYTWLLFGVSEELDVYSLPEITIGGVRLKTKTEVAKSEVMGDRILETEGLDGILGLNVFEGYWCELSFSKKKIIIHKKKPARFEKFVPVGLVEGNLFCISVDVDERRWPFIVDTGVPGMYFPPSVIVGNTENEKILLKTRSFYLVKTNKISVFDDVFEDKAIVTDTLCDGNNVRGLLGIEFLKDYDLLFDFTNLPFSASGLYYKRINTERDEKRSFPLEKAAVERILESGIYSFYRIPEGITLGIVEGSVLNAEYGVSERTIITKIDGKPAREISDADMWNMDVSRVKNFTVLENGEERTMEFKLGNR